MAGEIITLCHAVTPREKINRRAIVWDDAVGGDDHRWLVQWATTQPDVDEYQARTGGRRELDKPMGEPFIIRTEGGKWESLSIHYPASGFVVAGGGTPGRYHANDEAANGVTVMAVMAAERAAKLDEWAAKH